jgi:hypothetical protein
LAGALPRPPTPATASGRKESPVARFFTGPPLGKGVFHALASRTTSKERLSVKKTLRVRFLPRMALALGDKLLYDHAAETSQIFALS